MKLPFLALLGALVTGISMGQDRLVLISGDTLNGKINKVGGGKVSFNDQGLEMEITSGLVSTLILESGKKSVLNPIPESLDFEDKFQVLAYTKEIESEIATLFPQAKKREYQGEGHGGYDLSRPLELTEYQQVSLVGNHLWEETAHKMFRKAGQACNAFLALVTDTKNGYRYTYYYNTPSAETLRQLIVTKSFRHTESYSVEWWTTVSDLVAAEAPLNRDISFAMTFKDDNSCLFSETSGESILNYTVDKDANMTYSNPAKPKLKPRTWQVVFVSGDHMRYTEFKPKGGYVTRRVDVIKQ